MPNYRRARLAGATYFFTVNLADRSSRLLVERIATLRAAFRMTHRELPFRVDAIVVLPDHIHCIWTLPETDSDFSLRWQRIKARFSNACPASEPRGVSRSRKRERGIWQRRFWEHLIRDEHDLAAHIDYVHYNPVKHGHAIRAIDWPYSSMHRFVRRALLAPDWGSTGEFNGGFGEAT
jgi:putative transposase